MTRLLTLAPPATRWATAWGAITALAGTVTLLRAGRFTAGSSNTRYVPRGLVVALGLREVAQGVVVAVVPTSEVVAGAAAIEVLHGSSMVAAALLFPRYRRAAVVAAAAAAASAGTGGGILTAAYARACR